MIVYLLLTLSLGLSFGILFFYFFSRGQFDDIEDVKYQMFREDEDA